MIVTAGALYYSHYIKHFLGGRGERAGEIRRRDDVAGGDTAFVLFSCDRGGYGMGTLG